jgi:hypothetical protein
MQRTWLGAGGMDSVSCMIDVEDPQEAAFASLCQLGVHIRCMQYILGGIL